MFSARDFIAFMSGMIIGSCLSIVLPMFNGIGLGIGLAAGLKVGYQMSIKMKKPQLKPKKGMRTIQFHEDVEESDFSDLSDLSWYPSSDDEFSED